MRVIKLLPWLIVLAPVVALFFLMQSHLVNIPYLDEFMFQPMFEKLHNGFRWTLERDDAHLTLHDFFLVQMEHRMAFVRAVIMLRHCVWPSDVIPENWVSFVLLVITVINVGIMLRKTTGQSFSAWWPVFALASFAICSPIQYQIVLWAMMFQVATPACALSTTLVVLMSKRVPVLAKWIIGFIAAMCATQSIACGILVWLLPLPLMLWGKVLPEGKTRWIYVGCWLAVFGVTMALYFHDLHNEVDGPFAYKQEEVKTMERNVDAVTKDPVKAFNFVMDFVGGTLGRGLMISAKATAGVIGLVSTLALLAISVFWLRRFKEEELRLRLLPWLCFGYYSLGTGMLVALGRSWATNTGDNALSPRYTIHTVPLTVSLVAMGWILSRYFAERYPVKAMGIRSASTGLFVFAALLHVPSWIMGLSMMDAWESSRLRTAASTMFFNEHRVDVQGLVAANRQRARALEEDGLLAFKMTNSNLLSQFKMSTINLSKNTAWLKGILVDAQAGVCSAQGYACLRKRQRVADAVFLTYKNPEGEWVIFVVAQVQAMPLFLGDVLGRDMHKQAIHFPGEVLEAETLSGFNSEFALNQLPKESKLAVRAWAFNYKEKTAYPMFGEYELDTGKGTVRALDSAKEAAEER
jgi:hypothetical protein